MDRAVIDQMIKPSLDEIRNQLYEAARVAKAAKVCAMAVA
jgi:hypothetical protein